MPHSKMGSKIQIKSIKTPRLPTPKPLPKKRGVHFSYLLTLVLPFPGNGSENHTAASDRMLDPISPIVAASTPMNAPSVDRSIVIAFIDVPSYTALMLAPVDPDGGMPTSVGFSCDAAHCEM
jgi:hypothetical protein